MAYRVAVDDLGHRLGHLTLQLCAPFEHGLSALPVELLNGRVIRARDSFAKALLKPFILLIGGVSRKMQRNDRVCVRHGSALDPALGASCLLYRQIGIFLHRLRLQTKGPALAPALSESPSKAYAAAPTAISATVVFSCGRAASSGKATASTSSMPLA